MVFGFEQFSRLEIPYWSIKKQNKKIKLKKLNKEAKLKSNATKLEGVSKKRIIAFSSSVNGGCLFFGKFEFSVDCLDVLLFIFSYKSIIYKFSSFLIFVPSILR